MTSGKNTDLKLLSDIRCFGGKQLRYSHWSNVNNCEMTFAAFIPPQAEEGRLLPTLYWLSGLTCTDDNFVQKAGAQRVAAELGIIIIAPDTSPRGDDVPDVADAWDVGKGAGFYVNATQMPWKKHYQMYDYVVTELPALVNEAFPVNDKQAISGHSMGGHGALITALTNQAKYTSVSAFAPIVNPLKCPWGEKAFSLYLGESEEQWQQYDACALMETHGCTLPILIEQGDADSFLEEQLKPHNFVQACKVKEVDVILNMQPNYDHSYFFISSFIESHIRWHAKYLNA